MIFCDEGDLDIAITVAHILRMEYRGESGELLLWLSTLTSPHALRYTGAVAHALYTAILGYHSMRGTLYRQSVE